MQNGIGSTLREARNRRKVRLSEVEEATKIRIGFLRAIEAEEWDALPGEAYARSFVRTYAEYLGLDGARLADEMPVLLTLPVLGGGAEGALSRQALAAIVCAGLVAVIVLVGLFWGGGSGGGSASTPSGPQGDLGGPGQSRAPATPVDREARAGNGAMALSLTTKAELWVCLLDENGKPLVDGVVLPAGAEEGPFRSGSFTVSFGNGEVEMQIDGRETDIPESASPLGYEVRGGGELRPLTESERPTCI